MSSMIPSRRSFLLGSAAAAASAGLTNGRAARAADPSELRVLTIAGDPGALPLYAESNGFFSNAGLNADVTTMTNGAAILAAVAGDAVQIGNGNAGSIAAAVLRGLPFTVIADGGLYEASEPITLLCVLPDSSIDGPKALAGKKIALNGIKQIGQAAVQAWMDKNDADWKSVGFLEMPFSVMGSALAARRVDAIFVVEPLLTELRGKVRVIGAPFDAVAPEFSYAAYAAKSDWVATNKDIARRFISVMRESAQWANSNPRPAGRILAGKMKLPEAVVTSMRRVRYATQLDASHLQPVIDVMARYGYLPSRVDANRLITHL